MLIVSNPGVTGRCDLYPLSSAWERVRFYSIECILTVLLISGAYDMSDSKRITRWLNMWALYAYCFHVCWARIFPYPFHGALFTYGSMPVFYCLQKLLENRKVIKMSMAGAVVGVRWIHNEVAI